MDLINRFGSGRIYTMDEMIKTESMVARPMIYCTSTACMSVTTDMISWLSKNVSNIDEMNFVSVNKPSYNNIIIVLGCQVTDLAILNDIRTAERLHEENPEAKVYMGGCLAYRFDVELPAYINRLAATRSEYTEINPLAKNMIHWEKPFWIKDWSDQDDEMADGHLFRDMYPLKIGAGCSGKCKYCTIRDTRGSSYEVDAYLQVKEFINHENIVLISDSPTTKQLKDWAKLAIRYNKGISIRNVEPAILCSVRDELIKLAKASLLPIVHCPIQSNNPELLKVMNRSVDATLKAIEVMDELRELGVKVATNIIIDYRALVDRGNGSGITDLKLFRNFDTEWLDKHFDYYSWNPYFDGIWDIEEAQRRFDKYINNRD